MSDQVEKPEDLFSHNEAHIMTDQLTSSVNAGFIDWASFDKFFEYSTSVIESKDQS